MEAGDVKRAITKSATNLIFSEPFVGSLLPRVELLIYPPEWFTKQGLDPTAATDGQRIYCCDEFIRMLNEFEINAVLAHEIFHCLLLHFSRQGNREPKKWNIACDFSLNPFVDEIPRCTLPKGALLDLKYKGMTAERIYDLLPDDVTSGGTGIDLICDNLSESETTAQEIEWRGAVAVAAQQAKVAGKMSAELEQFIELLLKPKIPWQQVLYNFMVKPILSIAKWNRYNRRFRHRGLKFPQREVIKTGTFVFSVDLSGSMSDDAIERCLVELQYVVNIVNPERVIIVEHDSKLLHTREFPYGQDMPTKFDIHGRGGTDFCPVFEYVDSLNEKPEALVLMTDGYGSYPKSPPEYPVLWALCETDESMQMSYGEQLWID